MRHLLFILAFFCAILSFAQGNAIVLIGTDSMSGATPHRLSDRGFIIVGTDFSGPSFTVLKTDSVHTVLWTFNAPLPAGYTNQHEPYEVAELPDGSIVILIHNTPDLVRISAGGTLLWYKHFADPALSQFAYVSGWKNMVVDPLGRIVLAGECSDTTFDRAAIIHVIDSTGNWVWRKQYSTSVSDSYSQITCTSDGGYTAVGLSIGKVLLVHCDATGTVLWSVRYDCFGFPDPAFYELLQCADGSYVIVGRTEATGDALILKFDSAGVLLWSQVYGDNTNTTLYGVIETGEGYVVFGSSQPQPNCGVNGLIMCLDKMTGNKFWQAIMTDPSAPLNDHTCYYYCEQTANGFLIGGSTDLLWQPVGYFNAGLFYTDQVGVISCYNYVHNLPPVAHTPLALTMINLTSGPMPGYELAQSTATVPKFPDVTYVCPVGVNENPLHRQLVVYPNPANDLLSLRNCSDNQFAVLYNSMGQIAVRQTLNPGDNALDISACAPGAYLLEVNDDAGNRWVQTVIVE